jgi:hypothetical protein
MRIVAWKCHERFDRNYLHLRDLEFDFAVVTECGPFDTAMGETREVTSVLKLGIHQPGHSKHNGVLAQSLACCRYPPDRRPTVAHARESRRTTRFHCARCLAARSRVGRRSPLLCDADIPRCCRVLPMIDGPAILAGDLNTPDPVEHWRRSPARRERQMP